MRVPENIDPSRLAEIGYVPRLLRYLNDGVLQNDASLRPCHDLAGRRHGAITKMSSLYRCPTDAQDFLRRSSCQPTPSLFRAIHRFSFPACCDLLKSFISFALKNELPYRVGYGQHLNDRTAPEVALCHYRSGIPRRVEGYGRTFCFDP